MKLIVPGKVVGDLKKNIVSDLSGRILVLLALFFSLFLSANNTAAQTRTLTFNSSGTWKVPCGVTTATVYVWGAGGAGAGAVSGAAYGSGGGGGAFIWNVALPVTPNTTYTITVGAGGSGGTGNGGPGGNSSFGSLIVAGGGQGGIRTSTSGGLRGIAITVPGGSAAYVGGNGAPGTATYGGGGGSTGSAPFNNAVDATGQPGAIAPAGGGNGGDGTVVNGNANGSDGASPGGGGGGARRTSSSRSGGDGADGRVVIVYDGPPSNYCTPAFTSAVEPITSVSFGGFTKTSSAALITVNPQNFSLQTHCDVQGNVTKGQTYPIIVKGNTDGNYTDHFRAFIDWNQNGVLNDAGESFDIGDITYSTGLDAKTATANITVPNNASTLLGKTIMRVMKRYNADPTNPCATNYTYGEAEDYVINVQGPCQHPTGATATGNSVTSSTSITVCVGQQVTLKQTGGLIVSGQQFEWTKLNCTTGTEYLTSDPDGTINFTPGGPGTTVWAVKAVGGTCGAPSTCATVTVNVVAPGTVSVNSGTADFTACRGVANTNFVRFIIGGGATGAGITGLPTGMTGTYDVGTKQLTVSGNPSAATGTYNYTVTLTGAAPCVNPTLTGTITITDRPTVSYAAGTFTYCIGSNITANTPTISTGNSTTTFGISPALPLGLTLNTSNGEITGNPSGPASPATVYTVTANNACGSNIAAATVTIAVSAGNQVFTMSPIAPQTICSSSTGVVISLPGSENLMNYQLYMNGTPVAGTVVVGTGGPISFPAQNNAGTYTVVATTNCPTNMNGSFTLSVTTAPNTTFTYPSYVYCRTGLSPAAIMANGPLTGTFTSSPAGLVFSNASTGVIDLASSAIGNNYSITYTVAAAGGCGVYTYTQPNVISITSSPNYYNVTGGGAYCSGGAGLNVGLDGSQTGATYELYRNGTPLGITIPGTGGAISFGLQTIAGTYNIFASIGNCSAEMDGDAEIIVNAAAPAIAVTPASATACQGVVIPLTASVNPPSVTNSDVTVASLTGMNQSIPDNSQAGTSNLLRVTGVPAGASITGVEIKFHITHLRVGDLVINLKGPNGNVLNIVDRKGSTGDHFGTSAANSTTVNSASNTSITTIIASQNPFATTAYAPEAAGGIAGSTVVSANISNVNTFSSLYDATSVSANGNWIFSVKDIVSGTNGALNFWSIKISYTTVNNPSTVTWSPAASLYSDPAGTIPYVSGTNAATVYAKPASSGLITATYTAAGGCTSTATSNLTINPSPVITMSADYCNNGGTPGTVRINAVSTLSLSSWIWNTGATTGAGTSSFIEVNTAGSYYVSGKSAGNSCPAKGVMSIAQELVTNGNFELGNVGFTSDYTYHVDQPGLVPAGQGELWDDTGTNGYGVGTNGQNYHIQFFGVDHTYGTGTGNFMVINGHGSNLILWKNENVTVLPNTKYYFSAYGMSLNNSAATGEFRFEITDNNNVTTIATSQVLPVGVNDNSNNSWTKFYGEMTTGPTTTSVDIKIVNLNASPGGNDFGLDDVSFATLSTFFAPPVNPTDTSQLNVCLGSPITDILFEAGGDGSSPSLSAGSLPPGVSAYWNGRTYRISGTPTQAGTWNFTLQLTTSCGSKQRKGIITVLPAAQAGTFAAGPVLSACYNTSGNMATQLSGTVASNGLVWQTSPNGLAPWTNAASTYSNLTSAVYYRAIATHYAGCKKDTSAVVKLGVGNLWTGTTSSDWNTVTNWSNGAVPSFATCDTVYIPNVSPRSQPFIGSGTVSVKNLKVLPTASIDINNDAKLAVSASITSPVGAITATNGKIELNGTSGTQDLSGSWFVGKNVKELIISNNVNVSSVAGDTINILEKLSFGNTTADLNTGNNITLKSTPSRTAAVGQVAPGNVISNMVTIERYMPTYRGWRFVATPVAKGLGEAQTIRQSWQENNTVPSRYGTQITGPQGPAAGFDIVSAGASMKWFNAAINNYTVVRRTDTLIANDAGYMLFVRGDRSVGASDVPTSTNLRIKGKLRTGDQSFMVPGNLVQSIGNPYASSLRADTLVQRYASVGIGQFFIVWDPSLSGTYGAGGYQYLSKIEDYKASVSGSALYTVGTEYRTIQSGQAFYVVNQSGSDVNMIITESMKENGSRVAARENTPADRQFIRTKLYTNTDVIADGALVGFDDEFENGYDNNDAIKFANSGENFGMSRFGKTLAIEARGRLHDRDTIFYHMSNLREQTYKIELTPENLATAGVEAWFVDRFLNTQTPVSLSNSTTLNIAITSNAASKASNRFMLVFKQMSIVLPVNIVSVSATRNTDRSIAVRWKVENELNIVKYEVERSKEGVNFTGILDAGPVASNGGSASYLKNDLSPLSADNFYRIKAISLDGQVQYSPIVKVSALTVKSTISVNPNPVENKTLNVSFVGQAKGVYTIELLNAIGQIVYKGRVAVNHSNVTETILLDKNIAGGTYRLRVTGTEGEVNSQSIMVQ